MCLCIDRYVHSDCGGVANKQTGLVDVPEYVRWSQHCALGAIHRYHGGPGHQPWLYNSTIESIIRQFLDMRMKLLPTIIAAAARASVDAMPVVRRCDLAYPTAGPNATRMDQYLLGDDTLIAPISGGWSHNGTATRELWIPPGAWTDAWTGASLTGPAMVHSVQPLSRIPMFHKAGGLVVTAKTAQTVESQDWSVLTLEAFPFAAAANTTESVTRQLSRQVVREGESGETIITMTQSAAELTPLSSPAEHRGLPTARTESVEIAISHTREDTPRRAWLVRVHLRPTQGATLLAGDHSQNVRTIQPVGASDQVDDDESFVPFGGVGTAPARLAGPVFELMLRPRATSVRVRIITYKAIEGSTLL